MALRYRVRRISATVGGGTFTFTPAAKIMSAADQWNQDVQLANDRNALEKLAAGHSEWFIAFAKERLVKESDPEQKAYWQGLLDETQRKITEDNLSQEVAGDPSKLEKLASYLEQRMQSVGPTSGDYANLVKQYGDVTKAIAARDFNGRVNDAQKALIQTGDHAAYAKALSDIVDSVRDPAARDALAKQIGQVQDQINAERTTSRYAEANAKVIAYVNGEVSRPEIMSYLRQMAASADTPEEANRYTSLATQIDTRERTLERQRATSAAGSGAKALQDALDPKSHAYDAADAAVVSAMRLGNADRNVFTTFQTEAKDYLDTLREILPQAATRSMQDQISNEINAVIKNVAEREKQMATAIVNDVTREADGFLRAASSATAVTSFPEQLDVAAQQRFLATQALSRALSDPLVKAQADQVDRLQTKLDETTKAHQKDIASYAAIVAGTDGPAPLKSANRSAFNAYQDYMAQVASNPFIQKNAPVDYQAFLDAIDQYGTDPVKLAAALGISVVVSQKNADKTNVANAQREVSNLTSTWTNNISQATDEQMKIVQDAQHKLDVLVAPRTLTTGRRVTDQLPSNELTDVTDYLRQFGKPPMLVTGRAQDVAPNELNTYAGAGLIAPTTSGRPAGSSLMIGGDNAPDVTATEADSDPYTRAEQAAFHFLSRTNAPIDLPSWDVPPPPNVFAQQQEATLRLTHEGVPDAPLLIKQVSGASSPAAGDAMQPTLAA